MFYVFSQLFHDCFFAECQNDRKSGKNSLKECVLTQKREYVKTYPSTKVHNNPQQ